MYFQIPAFTKGILNEKLHFLCSENKINEFISGVFIHNFEHIKHNMIFIVKFEHISHLFLVFSIVDVEEVNVNWVFS